MVGKVINIFLRIIAQFLTLAVQFPNSNFPERTTTTQEEKKQKCTGSASLFLSWYLSVLWKHLQSRDGAPRVGIFPLSCDQDLQQVPVHHTLVRIPKHSFPVILFPHCTQRKQLKAPCLRPLTLLQRPKRPSPEQTTSET